MYWTNMTQSLHPSFSLCQRQMQRHANKKQNKEDQKCDENTFTDLKVIAFVLVFNSYLMSDKFPNESTQIL